MRRQGSSPRLARRIRRRAHRPPPDAPPRHRLPRRPSHLDRRGPPPPDGGPADVDAADGGGPAADAGARCGDGARQGAEACDGTDLGGASCASLGLGAGVLACDAACAFDGSGCRTCTPSCAGRECGADGCGGSCGTCAAPERCGGEGLCVCAPACDGRECGDDGCGGSCGACAGTARCEAGLCISAGGLVITEVFYNAVGADDQLEWVELHNTSGATVDLSGYSIGAGGADYTYSVYQLSGSIPPGGCRVVGGPVSGAANGAPLFGQAADFAPDVQNSGTVADGVALFAVPASSITPASVPIDAVIYGVENGTGLLDETGLPGAVDVENAPEGGSIERTASGWRTRTAPDPNRCGL
ncbi:MAG: lamin tail domain-containing protein [Sandaracinaceae bacterium]|nr:lamin tail domain-containing protein [Sandaracinaceae bacterium]